MDDGGYRRPSKHIRRGPPPTVAAFVSVIGFLAAVSLVVIAAWLRITRRPYVVLESSMAPAIFVGDEIHADTSAFGLRLLLVGSVRAKSEPERGDVVVMTVPPSRMRAIVVRVVAIGGDDVQVFSDGSVDIQGKPLSWCSMGTWPTGRDPNGKSDGRRAFVEWNGAEAYVVLQGNEEQSGGMCVDAPCQVPPGYVYALGDNRADSDDSRHWGFVAVEHLVGKVVDVRVPDDMPAWNECIARNE